MDNTDIAIIGGGPAGMCAAIAAAEQGARVTLFDRNKVFGGQLIKQTHRFFGSEREHAGTRGINIADMFLEKIKDNKLITMMPNTTVLSIYHDGVITYENKNKYDKLTADKTIITTGASEKMLVFKNNDLPGVYGAGAVQTLMNQYGVVPGDKVLMIGAGNIGLIVSYQLIQAGVKVEAIIDAAPGIGGYQVHAAKIKRLGIPLLLRTSIKEAIGEDYVEGAVIASLDENWKFIPGTEKKIDVDTICLAVGLSPLVELLNGIECEMKYCGALGGFVAKRDENLQTTAQGYYVAGDVGGIEEASSAMLEGTIAGLSAANSLGYGKDIEKTKKEYIESLIELREGPTGQKTRMGLEQIIG